MDDIKPFVSVVIATYNRPAHTSKCLSALLLNSYDHYELIVVDQSQNSKTREVIHRLASDKIKYLHSDVIGLSHARNLGCQTAKGTIIAFIDDDAVASPDWIASYVESFIRVTPSPAMVGGKIDPAWEIPRPLWYPPEREYLLGIYDKGNVMMPFPQTDLPIGANFAVRKDIVDALGGFDSRVGFDNSRRYSMIAGEDSLLGIMVRDAGHAIYYQPRAAVTHYISAQKLTRIYFLKRHFWEGATHIVMDNCKQKINNKRLKEIIIWHVKNIGKVFADIMTNILKEQQASKRMLNLSEIAYSYGVCVQSLKLRRQR